MHNRQQALPSLSKKDVSSCIHQICEDMLPEGFMTLNLGTYNIVLKKVNSFYECRNKPNLIIKPHKPPYGKGGKKSEK